MTIVIMTGAAVAQANSPSRDTATDSAAGTYIVGFSNDGSRFGAMGDQFGTFAAENDAQVLDRYHLINAVKVSVPSQEAADKLSSLPGVSYVEKDVAFHAALAHAAPQIGAPVARESGYTGKGVTIAIVDTGIDGTHPDFKGRIVGWKDIVNNKPEPYDDFGHGTHCAGIIAGSGAASNGKYRGIAPEADLIAVKVLSKDGSGNESDILAGIEYAAGTDAQVISLSLGSDEHSQAICDAVSSAVRKGKIVVCAAGNSGPKGGTIGCPSDNKDVISVGAVDPADYLCSFSSRGPCKDGSLKPDIVAPGYQIISCRAHGIMDNKAVDKYYLAESGTSMACPMVSGTVALMMQVDPKLTPVEAKEVLEKTAKHLGTKTPNPEYGYGRINITAALEYLGGKLTNPVPSPTPKPSPRPGITPTPAPAYPSRSRGRSRASGGSSSAPGSARSTRPGTRQRCTAPRSCRTTGTSSSWRTTTATSTWGS
jgi:serine protease AprX